MANTNLSSSIDDIQIYRDNYIREINNSNDNHALIIIKATSNRVGLGHGGTPAVGTSPYFSFTY